MGDILFCCSFCGKSQQKVSVLIGGSNNTFICNDCIDLCAEIRQEHEKKRELEDAEN